MWWEKPLLKFLFRINVVILFVPCLSGVLLTSALNSNLRHTIYWHQAPAEAPPTSDCQFSPYIDFVHWHHLYVINHVFKLRPLLNSYVTFLLLNLLLPQRKTSLMLLLRLNNWLHLSETSRHSCYRKLFLSCKIYVWQTRVLFANI